MSTPILEFSTTSQFDPVWSDRGSGAKRSAIFFRPIPPDGFYLLGDYGQSHAAAPNASVFTVRVKPGTDDPDEPGLVQPEDWALVWTDEGSGGDRSGSFWAPVAPPGYVTCGHVIQRGWVAPILENLCCVRFDLATDLFPSRLIWTDEGSGADRSVAVFRVPKSGVIWAIPDHESPDDPAWLPLGLVT